jgi:hypothetical protein
MKIAHGGLLEVNMDFNLSFKDSIYSILRVVSLGKEVPGTHEENGSTILYARVHGVTSIRMAKSITCGRFRPTEHYRPKSSGQYFLEPREPIKPELEYTMLQKSISIYLSSKSNRVLEIGGRDGLASSFAKTPLISEKTTEVNVLPGVENLGRMDCSTFYREVDLILAVNVIPQLCGENPYNVTVNDIVRKVDWLLSMSERVLINISVVKPKYRFKWFRSGDHLVVNKSLSYVDPLFSAVSHFTALLKRIRPEVRVQDICDLCTESLIEMMAAGSGIFSDLRQHRPVYCLLESLTGSGVSDYFRSVLEERPILIVTK